MLRQPPPRSTILRQFRSVAIPIPLTIPPRLTPSSSPSFAQALAAMAQGARSRVLSTPTIRLPPRALSPRVLLPSHWAPPQVLQPRRLRFLPAICCSLFKCRTRTLTPRTPVPMDTEFPAIPAQAQLQLATQACLSSLPPRTLLRFL